jgi:hypothetical protein
MKNRTLLILLLSGIALAATLGVCLQGKELSQLRSNRAQLLSGDSPVSEPAATSPPPGGVISSSPDQQSELLRLRNEISQLNRRKKELAIASSENSRLKAELQAKAAASKPMPGYVRQSEAVMAGFARPEDTLQTFLWALRNGDTNTLFQTFTPKLRPSRLEDLKAFVGMGITARTNLPDGAIRLTVHIASGLPDIGIVLRDFNGAWKMDKID